MLLTGEIKVYVARTAPFSLSIDSKSYSVVYDLGITSRSDLQAVPCADIFVDPNLMLALLLTSSSWTFDELETVVLRSLHRN